MLQQAIVGEQGGAGGGSDVQLADLHAIPATGTDGTGCGGPGLTVHQHRRDRHRIGLAQQRQQGGRIQGFGQLRGQIGAGAGEADHLKVLSGVGAVQAREPVELGGPVVMGAQAAIGLTHVEDAVGID